MMNIINPGQIPGACRPESTMAAARGDCPYDPVACPDCCPTGPGNNIRLTQGVIPYHSNSGLFIASPALPENLFAYTLGFGSFAQVDILDPGEAFPIAFTAPYNMVLTGISAHLQIDAPVEILAPITVHFAVYRFDVAANAYVALGIDAQTAPVAGSVIRGQVLSAQIKGLAIPVNTGDMLVMMVYATTDGEYAYISGYASAGLSYV